MFVLKGKLYLYFLFETKRSGNSITVNICNEKLDRPIN